MTSIYIDEAVEMRWVKKEIPSEEYWKDIEKGFEEWLNLYDVSFKNGDTFLVGKSCFRPYRYKDGVEIDLILRYVIGEDGKVKWERIVSAYWEYDDPVYEYKYDIQHQMF